MRLGAVHKLRLQEEGGMWSKNVHIFQRSQGRKWDLEEGGCSKKTTIL